MSEIKVNKISPRAACGTVTLGDSGDTFTIPAGATITNAGTANGFGADGAVNWQTSIKTATFTAANQEGYFCNTSGGAFTVNLPAGSAGNIIAIKDYAGTFQTNNLTISPNGSDKIDGTNGPATISTENAAIVLVFADSTRGWLNVNDSTSVEGSTFITATGGTITTVCTNFKVHTFTGPGTFCVSAGAGPLAKADYVVVAGGGGGGTGIGGGGGAGGFRESSGASSGCYTASPLGACVSALTLSPGPYSIVVGGGGTAGSPSPRNGGRGNVSTFSTITSTGGGGGGGNTPDSGANGPGGSGGGATYNSLSYPSQYPGNAALAGNTPPVSPPQGFPGGTGSNPVGAGNPPGPPCAATRSGGGGGATAAGQNNHPLPSPAAGKGGDGATTSINGTPTTYAGGGGGVFNTSGAPGPGGTGGGGAGAPGPSGGGGTGTSGTTNTGGGGGSAGDPAPAGAGGSGIVMIRYRFQ